MLVQAAANDWKAPIGEIMVERGVVRHGARQTSFGALAAKARVPAGPDQRPPARFEGLGLHREGPRDARQVRQPRQIVGTAGFHHRREAARPADRGDDPSAAVRRDGALLRRCEGESDARRRRCRADAARACRCRGQHVAGAQGARGGHRHLGRERSREAVERRPDCELPDAGGAAGQAVAANVGNVERAVAGAAKVLEATFEFPYLAHAALEPLNAVARIQDGRVEVWAGTRCPTSTRPSPRRRRG